MKTPEYQYREASLSELELRWDKNIADNAGDDRWTVWKAEAIEENMNGRRKAFVIMRGGDPIGEGGLLFSPQCGAVNGRLQLADGTNTVNVNALRIDKPYEGKGHISKLVKVMEQYAASKGYKTVTIGVEAKETRNLGIYLHWGYNTFVLSEVEDSQLILYYSKNLRNC